jgi:glutaredoxin
MFRFNLSPYLFMPILFQVDVLATEYFNSGIDYWGNTNKNTLVKKDNNRKTDLEVIVKNKIEKDKFSWKRQLNPKNDDFFREGDYLPPKSFMELVRNPSDQNIKNWFALMKKKNELSLRLSSRISNYLQKSGGNLAPESKSVLIKQNIKLANNEVSKERNELRFRMYFDSKCPHCERMMKTMESLSNMGYFVELRQIDNDKSKLKNIRLPIVKTTRDELNDKDVKSVPLLFVGDLKNKVVYRLSGYQSVQSIFQSINTKKGIKVSK